MLPGSMSTPPAERKRSRRTLGEGLVEPLQPEPEGALGPEELKALRDEIDGRLARIEARVEDGLSALQSRISDGVGGVREVDPESVREEVQAALQEFESRILGDLKEARSKGDRERVHLLEN